jgi:hypothetical protein
MVSVGAALSVALGVLLAALASSPAQALPRYSARYQQNCSLCHISPTGGGMRSLYASQYLVPQEMAWSTPGDDLLELIDPQVSKSITLGADFRLLHLYSDEEVNTRNFFEMQGDLYVSFQMSPRLALYYDRGISESYELFALAHLLPWDGYVKAGRFIPAYGWRLEDHTSFVRSELGFFPPAHTDAGVELGIYPRRLAVQLSLLNGNRGGTLDDDDRLAVALRALYRFSVGGVGLAAGASGLHNPREDGDHDSGGFFGYLSYGRLTWVGEIDWNRFEPDDGGHTTALVTSHEVAFQLRRGLELKGTYDFYDPDHNLQTGARNRYGGGVYLMPNPFLALEALVRGYDVESGRDLRDEDFVESVLQLHLFY